MAYRHFEYKDPLDILIERENKTCKGCIHKRQEKVFGIEIEYCAQGKKKMIRCKLYQEKE